ncbi:MAG: LamG domain-containing protein [Leptospiraceae bacterium]|nr:LamG domain-containing protein [Leptospiraceae bacterium]MCB1171558.1 LamG domain-containing protein [Leptospiraceae bacterium]
MSVRYSLFTVLICTSFLVGCTSKSNPCSANEQSTWDQITGQNGDEKGDLKLLACLLGAVGAGSGFPAGVSTENLQGMYQFEADLADSSGNGRTGTMNGTLTYTTSIVAGRNSTQSVGPFTDANFITFPASAYPLDGDYTIGMFIKGPASMPGANTQQHLIMKFGQGQTDNDNTCHGAAYELKFGVAVNGANTAGAAYFQIGASPADWDTKQIFSDTLSPTAVPNVYDGNVHFIAIRISGTTMKMWVDGNTGTTSYSATRIASTASDVTVGKCAQFGNHAFPGTVDELYIFNRALSDAEVESIRASYTY